MYAAAGLGAVDCRCGDCRSWTIFYAQRNERTISLHGLWKVRQNRRLYFNEQTRRSGEEIMSAAAFLEQACQVAQKVLFRLLQYSLYEESACDGNEPGNDGLYT